MGNSSVQCVRSSVPAERGRLRIALLAAAIAAWSPGGHAERADRNKPVHLEADRIAVDDVKMVHTYEGGVILRQGTLLIRGDKIVVRQDAEGFQHGTAWGSPASFRVKREAFDEYVEGWADRIEFNAKADLAEFFSGARLKREQDEIQGHYISYDGKTEFYRVVGAAKDAGGEGKPAGRVSAVIQPRNKPNGQPAPTPAPPQTPAITPPAAPASVPAGSSPAPPQPAPPVAASGAQPPKPQ